ncbi:23S rRNA (adenine(2503)-C(2))-methyltransferase RlmN [bacterium]|nr:23S rRNA (adenine(2503)-C(2))-methyltransferase RlmN [bacterium]
MKENLLGLTREEIERFVVSLGQKPFRGRQIMKWIYGKGVFDFDVMTDISVPLRDNLKEVACIEGIELAERVSSPDGSVKYAFRLSDGNIIESVLIFDASRVTVCLSSQVGCPLGCLFCATGKVGFVRNLTSGEIVDQIIQIKKDIPGKRVTNLVFMGMGEPLLNYDNLVRALRVITSEFGLSIGARHINVSTVGIPDRIRALADEGFRVKLAISLNATTNETRSRLMPINEKHPIEELLSAASYFARKSKRWVTFEYVLIRGINDSVEDASRLAGLIEDIPSKVNLIPYNPIEGVDLSRPSLEVVERFQRVLLDNHITATIRFSKGTAISAACGQLSGRLKKRN